MAGGAYYNEIEPVAAEWLRRLIAADLIAPGEVDERDIRDVRPDELRGFVQCHFFAGIGIWSHALRRAGWPDDRQIWTGSCPCQPFSDAGRKAGTADERHLWPHWQWLIAHNRPPIVVGEQVASKDGLGWLDLVSADMEGAGYAFGAADLCAAGFGMDWRSTAWRQWLQRAVWDCPDPLVAGWVRHFAEWADQSLIVGGQHIRQRLYFAAIRLPDPESGGWGISWDAARAGGGRHADRSGDPSSRLGDANDIRAGRDAGIEQGAQAETAGQGQANRLGRAADLATGSADRLGDSQGGQARPRSDDQGPGRASGLEPPQHGDAERMGDRERARSQGHAGHGGPEARRQEPGRPAAAPSLPERVGDADERPKRRRAGALHGAQGPGHKRAGHRHSAASGPERLDESASPRLQGREIEGPEGYPRDQARVRGPADGRGPGRLGDAEHLRLHAGEPGDAGTTAGERRERGHEPDRPREPERASEADELRAPFDWVYCRDGFWRPTEPGASPLAHAVAGRVGKLRSYGNGLDAETATSFVEIVIEICEELSCPTKG